MRNQTVLVKEELSSLHCREDHWNNDPADSFPPSLKSIYKKGPVVSWSSRLDLSFAANPVEMLGAEQEVVCSRTDEGVLTFWMLLI